MDIFLNPNIAYLILVVGFLFAVLALVTPGTGILEGFAVIIILISGYLISQLNFNWYALLVLILGVLPFLAALRMTNRWVFLFIALVSMVLGSTFLFVDSNWRPIVNPILSILVNLLIIGFFWIVVRKGLDALRAAPRHGFKDIEKSIAESRTEVFHEGSVYADGEMWSATSAKPIAAHKKVKILKRNGFTLEVEEIKDTKL